MVQVSRFYSIKQEWFYHAPSPLGWDATLSQDTQYLVSGCYSKLLHHDQHMSSLQGAQREVIRRMTPFSGHSDNPLQGDHHQMTKSPPISFKLVF